MYGLHKDIADAESVKFTGCGLQDDHSEGKTLFQ